MIDTKLIMVLVIGILFNTSLSAEQRMCFGQVPPDASNKLVAKISVSQGNKIFKERKCSHYFKYYDGHVNSSQNQCNVDTVGLTLDRGYAPFGVFFRGWESTPKADIQNYHWEIKSADGAKLATYDAFNAAYVFEEPGKYTATLTVTSTNGSQSVAQHTVDVWERKGNNYYVDSKIGDDRYNGLAKIPEASCDVTKSSVGSCKGPWKTATRAFGEMNPYDVKVMPDGKYTADAICLDNKVEEIRRYKQGNFKLFRSSTNIVSEATKDSDGNPLDLIKTDVCVKVSNKRKTVLSPGDQVLFKRNQTFEVETGINVIKSYQVKSDGTTYQYERLDTNPLTAVGHWSPAMGINFSTYGMGDKPLIKNVSKYSNVLLKLQGIGIMHFSMVDLSFDLESDTPNQFNNNRSNFVGLLGNPTTVVFKRVDVRNMNQGVVSGAKTGDGLFVFDSNFFDSNITQFYSHEHANVAIVSNKYDYSANHIIYSSINSGLVYNNVISRPAFGRTAFRLANGSMKNPDRFVWIAENKMTGWIDPRTLETHGRAFSNGKRYNYSLVNISPNVASSNKAVHDIVFTKNEVKDAENMLNIGNAENLMVNNNTFANSNSSQTSRIVLNAGYSRRPLKNITIKNNSFIETKDVKGAERGMVGATLEIRNFYQEKCNDQENHENITIMDNIFSLPGSHRRALMFAPLKQLETQPDLTLDQAESVLSKMVVFTNNKINTLKVEDVILQIGGDSRGKNPSDEFGGWPVFFEGSSKTGGKYRLYNQQSKFSLSFTSGTEWKQVFPESNIQQEDSTEKTSMEVQQESELTNPTSSPSSSSSEDNTLEEEASLPNVSVITFNETEDEAATMINTTKPRTVTTKLTTSPVTLKSEITLSNGKKIPNVVTMGYYKNSRGANSTSSVGFKKVRPCRAQTSDGACLLQ